MQKKVSKSPEETKKIAKDIVSNIQRRSIIALFGQLGSGKTTFVQGLAMGLGVRERIISPTFIIVREHKFQTANKKIKTLYHIDLYRVDEEGLESLGLEEIFSDREALVVIEWAEKIEKLLPKGAIKVYFTYKTENEREISINEE